MKKIAIILGAAFLLLTASLNAQTDTTKGPAKVSTDQWNNYSPEKYKLLPMPEPLTKEKIFPVIGHYNLTGKTGGASAEVTITIDESNKGIAWVEGLPQGKIKAYLRKAPASYMIPVQKAADGKDLSGGVMIYNKEEKTLDVCIGCTYNNDDPASAFTMVEQPVVEEPVATTKGKNKKGIAKAKVIPVRTWRYSGSKVGESTASVAPMQQ